MNYSRKVEALTHVRVGDEEKKKRKSGLRVLAGTWRDGLVVTEMEGRLWEQQPFNLLPTPTFPQLLS